MGTAPFADSAKLPSGTHAKLPKSASTKVPQQQRSAAERLRRLEEAIAFLRQHLATGPQPAKTLLQAAKAAGIAERTLHRAKDVLGVTAEHTGWHGEWVWVPPTAGIGTLQAAIVEQ
ncbi:MAG TPA: hypothetical protein VKT82_12055 [Ktedonobacterales bacterium]|nr:hypothetical protein [Ktedonobacterales bacterium]